MLDFRSNIFWKICGIGYTNCKLLYEGIEHLWNLRSSKPYWLKSWLSKGHALLCSVMKLMELLDFPWLWLQGDTTYMPGPFSKWYNYCNIFWVTKFLQARLCQKKGNQSLYASSIFCLSETAGTLKKQQTLLGLPSSKYLYCRSDSTQLL